MRIGISIQSAYRVDDVRDGARQMIQRAPFNEYAELGYTNIIIRNLHPDGDKAVDSTERLAGVKALLAQADS